MAIRAIGDSEMLSVIGVGFGRTGTMSLKLALETLGFKSCYHMLDVIRNPEHIPMWNDAADGKPVDWDKLFEGYAAAADLPPAHFWKQLMDHYPEAKIVLTIRDSESWYESAHNTIFKQSRDRASIPNSELTAHQKLMHKIVIQQTFDEKMQDRDHVIKTYERRNDEIQRVVPSERLLVFRISEGWGRLCNFLDKSVPDESFPKTNTTAEFRNNFSKAAGR